jgi:hypothetical protein
MAFRNDLSLKSQIEKFIAEGGLSPISTDMKESIVKYFPDIEKYEFQMEDIKAFYINCLKQELKEKAVQEEKTEERRNIRSFIQRVYLTIKVQVYSSVSASRILTPPEGFISLAQHEFILREERAYSRNIILIF